MSYGGGRGIYQQGQPGYGGSAPPPGGGYGGSVPPPGGGGYGGSISPAGGVGYGAAPHSGYSSPPLGGGVGYGGFGSSVAGGPPAGADPQLWDWFTAVDTNRSGAITAEELKQALKNGDWTPFEMDTVKMLMAIFDPTRTGQIGFAEFSGLWKYVKDWQGVFHHFDRDRSGTIEQDELRQAVTQLGYNLDEEHLRQVILKYATTPQHYGRGRPLPGITFEGFIRACVTIKQLTESFERLDTQRTGWVQISYQQFMSTGLALP